MNAHGRRSKLRLRRVCVGALVLLGAGCGAPPSANEDQLTGAAFNTGRGGLRTVTATRETPGLFDDDLGENSDADDPAIWVHPTRSAASLIFGTAKEGGLLVHDLAARQLQRVAAPAAPGPDDEGGRFNNVDVLYAVNLGGQVVDVAVVSDRGRDQIRFYKVDAAAAAAGGAPLTDITAANVPFAFSADQAEVNKQATAYGLTVARRPSDGRPFAMVSRNNRAQIALFEIFAVPGGQLSYRRTSSIALPTVFTLPDGTSWTVCAESDDEQPQVEGMVADEVFGLLYLAQEDVGIWRLDPWKTAPVPVLIDKVREYGVPYDRVFDPAEDEFICTTRFDRDPGFAGKTLLADAEGLTIYYADDDDDDGYLLASSQGDSTFAIYERVEEDTDRANRLVGRFQVSDGSAMDSVQHSDGAAVINVPLGRDFPQGLFVTQDGENTPDVIDADGEPRTNSNFKLVPWERIAKSFPRPLDIEPDDWAPR